MTIKKIVKRDGRVVKFDKEKIAEAIFKAAKAVGGENREKAEKLATQVIEILEKKHDEKAIPNVEEVQDTVEKVLIENGHAKTAKAYILYRQEKARIRETKKIVYGVEDDLKLTVNAVKVLERRYLLKNENGQIIETPKGMFKRVAKAIAKVDKKYNPNADVKKVEEEFYQIMASLEFIPNSPTLMNAGTKLGQLSACFVLPIDDSISSIFDAVKYAALIHQSGGGTGFAFSRLRPKGDIVKSTAGVASGPVSFMRVFDIATDVIKQGGRRRGANMGILRVDHPDVIDFIMSKETKNALTNFNISVAATDKFMEAVEKNAKYELINPRNKKVVDKVSAKKIFDLIVTMAWKTGDPGMIFIDRINRYNPTPALGKIESTNPCGEQPLLPYEACNLGSISLVKMVEEKDGKAKINWEKLGRVVRTAIHFLDNVIDESKFPLDKITKMVHGNRKVGLGVMGFADMLIALNIPYNSEEALKTAEKVMKFIRDETRKESEKLARERGVFPNYKKSVYAKKGIRLRNATLTTIAPTGTISIIGGVSSGIEPLFAISFIRNVMDNTELLEVNPLFEKVMRKRGIYSEELMRLVAQTGSIQHIEGIPKDIKKIFVTAHDIAPEWHVKMQAAFQKYVDNAVSKTINLKSDASIEDVRKAYLLAYKLRCKGITIYRDKSKDFQVLNIGSVNKPTVAYSEEKKYLKVDSTYAGGCKTCET